MLLNNLKVPIQEIDTPAISNKNCGLSVLRLDTIHPVVSGNKLFKLQYFLEDAIHLSAQKIITFGGAYSNHLVATAFACKEKNIPCIGIVRGEKPAKLSHTLLNCLAYGMELQFLSRADYDKKDAPGFIQALHDRYQESYIIPEGGFGRLGAKGAAGIHQFIDASYTHIICAVGTATTIAGLLSGANNHQKVIAIPVLKDMTDTIERIFSLGPGSKNIDQLSVFSNYHFGGYAKQTPELLLFMNRLFLDNQLPTDFVYTGKMMFAAMDLINKNHFPPGSKIICVHTGGLQGNDSLRAGTLTF